MNNAHNTAATKTATDSQGRLWAVTRVSDVEITLEPIGHDTDPDSDDLSREDEAALLALVDGAAVVCDDADPRGDMYDRNRDRYEEMVAGLN